MARIRTALAGVTVQVTVTGGLTAADMGRLEHACSPGLIYHPPNLQLDLSRVTYVDALAAMLLERLAARGVRVTGAEGIGTFPRPPRGPEHGE